jgi:hypothetical protein
LWVRLTAAVAAATLIAAAATGCGAGATRPAAAAQVDPLALGTVQVLAHRALRGTGTTAARRVQRSLPAHFAVSVDITLAKGARLELSLGSPGATLMLARGKGANAVLRDAGSTYPLRARSGWLRGDSRHFELTDGAVAVDGRRLPALAAPGHGATLSLRAVSGRAQVRGLIITDAGRRASLLLHRLAELHARVPLGARLLGSDRQDRLHYRSTWTSGFLAGALWQAASLVPQGGLFADWALAATLGHLGLEHAATHDVGFMYGQSSLLAWRRHCGAARARTGLCARLRSSVLAAAQELKLLAASNPGAGTIPTRPGGTVAETIVDSMMNIVILPWAARVTGNRSYLRLASHQAHVIGSLLVRPDGSTYQAVHFDRSSGRIVFVGTHQGIADTSTWSRGQGWALYGYAQAAQDLHDGRLLATAQQLAGYVSRQLPAGGIPPWDYSAPTGGPIDVSAGVIQAAGVLHLLEACNSMPGTCGDTSAWVPLSRTLLTGALGQASARPPLGLLGSEVLDGRRHTCCNGGELIFGLSYALEALVLERRLGG